jgi:hypothetical protein
MIEADIFVTPDLDQEEVAAAFIVKELHVERRVVEADRTEELPRDICHPAVHG